MSYFYKSNVLLSYRRARNFEYDPCYLIFKKSFYLNVLVIIVLEVKWHIILVNYASHAVHTIFKMFLNYPVWTVYSNSYYIFVSFSFSSTTASSVWFNYALFLPPWHLPLHLPSGDFNENNPVDAQTKSSDWMPNLSFEN